MSRPHRSFRAGQRTSKKRCHRKELAPLADRKCAEKRAGIKRRHHLRSAFFFEPAKEEPRKPERQDQKRPAFGGRAKGPRRAKSARWRRSQAWGAKSAPHTPNSRRPKSGRRAKGARGGWGDGKDRRPPPQRARVPPAAATERVGRW